MTALPQHLRELEHANAVRAGRAAQRRLLRAGQITLAQALEHPATQTMTVFDLLICQHRWGRTRALDALAHCDVYRISESKTIGTLSPRQRDSIVWWVQR